MNVKNAIRAAYAFLALTAAGLAYYGRDHYFVRSDQRVRLPLHPILRQSGSLGHFLGILGTLFLVLLLTYSLRKRVRFMRNWGSQNIWLEFHIWLGLAGPSLILFHAGFKFSGIIEISVWAMILVVASGIVGRYFYRLIPHSLSGMELNRIELEAEEIMLTFEIRKLLPPDHSFWDILAELGRGGRGGKESGSPLAFGETARLRMSLHRALKKVQILSSSQRKKLTRLIVMRQNMIKTKRFMEKTLKILHYWHLLHIPFVIILFLILLVHVYFTLTMGYRWIF